MYGRGRGLEWRGLEWCECEYGCGCEYGLDSVYGYVCVYGYGYGSEVEREVEFERGREYVCGPECT